MGVNVGLDIGVASVGVAVIDSETEEVLEVVSDIFECADASKNVDRRGFRQGKRLLRRRKNRINDFIKLWENSGYSRPEDVNIYPVELRVKALSEKISMDELYIVLLNELKHRGISYLEDSEDDIKGNSDYEKGLKLNQEELKSKYPCEIQLQRLKKYGRYRGQFTENIGEEKVTLSNIFTIGAYRKEVNKILETQKNYHALSEKFIEEYIKIFNRKRAYYEGPGNEKSRTDYGRFTTKIDPETGDYITDENIFEKLIGKCSVYPEEMRASAASYTAQEFNILNDLNNLTIGGRKLQEDEKREIISQIKNGTRVNVEKIICQVSGEDAETIQGARIDKQEKRIYHSFEVYRKMKNTLSDIDVDIDTFSREELDEIARILTLNTEKDGIINEFKQSSLGIDEKIVECFVDLRKKNGQLFGKWHSFSAKLMNDIIPDMYEQSKEQMTLLTEMGLIKKNIDKYKNLKYIPEKYMTDDLFNPVVVRSARIAVRALNAIIKKYGNPNMVVVEMPRDKNDEERKKRIKDEQAKNEKELKDIITKIYKEYGILIGSEHFKNHKSLALKLKLWNEQGGICLYSGKTIDINTLLSNQGFYEVDHIIPLSISFDDGRNNKVLVLSTENQDKGNRTPYMYLSNVNREWNWNNFLAKVLELKKSKSISFKKVENFLFTKDISKIDVLKGFINRNLNDTRYASRVVLNTLQGFFDANETKTKVKVVRGTFTSQMRKNMNLDKNREESFAHHAVDAMLIAYSQMGYDAFRKLQDSFIDFETGEILDKNMWMENMTSENYKNIIYGNKWSRIRNNIVKAEKEVKYWHRVDTKCNRGLCDQTIYGTREYDGKTYQISKIKDIRSDEGYKIFKKLVEGGKGSNLLVAQNDPKTYENLLKICEDYSDAKNPFVAYETETGDIVRKYSKKHNGPKIVSLKYKNGFVNSCIDISHKYGLEKDSKKVILGSLKPYRMDVYYNINDKKYYLIGVKYSDITCKGNKFVINEDAYLRILRQEKMINDNQTMNDLAKLGFEFKLSFYKNDIIQYEKDGKIYVERFLSRTMPASRNYIETKPEYKSKFDKRNLIGLPNTKEVRKIRTDILGNRFYCDIEKFKLEC